jgi:hypothetical protein
MKTLKKTNPKTNEVEYRRSEDKVADHAVAYQGWAFCPKSEWKTNVRDFGKEEAKRIAEEKAALKAEEKAVKKANKA